ncbi:MAG: MBL fold metallo-hydrolase [Candidatus Lokiarchaeota archaeon]
MIRIEIIILTNNSVLPFQDLRRDYGLEYIELNKLFASKSLAEHGLGFLISIFNDKEQIGKFIFDTGSSNHTFLHNLDLRGYPLYDLDGIILSHWHYDHFGSIYNILDRIEHEIPIISHQDALHERMFIRTKKYNSEYFRGKSKEEIINFINDSKIVVQEPINIDKAKELGGNVKFTSNKMNFFENEKLRVLVSGEISRKYKIEDFSNFLSLQDGLYKEDKIFDDKSIIFEFSKFSILLTGCCHSGIMNTLDYARSLTKKPITFIIGGLHMANATESRIKTTVNYLKGLTSEFGTINLFPIHCSGHKIIERINAFQNPNLIAHNASVGTKFSFSN